MLLLIDAGNTRIKWAIADTGLAWSGAPNWLRQDSVTHADIATLKSAWKTLPISQILISNVAGVAIQQNLESLLHGVAAGVKPEQFISSSECAGLKNAYALPAQLGCDRFASAIGAHALFPTKNLLVVTFGTATTIDAVKLDGTFIGGMILPGLGLMANALAHGTAQLPRILDHVVITTPFADNTEDAIMSGCIAAQVGAISTALTLQTQHHPGMEIKCILTGGSAGVIAPYLTSPHERVDHLVLTGLWTSIAAETER